MVDAKNEAEWIASEINRRLPPFIEHLASSTLLP